MAAARDFVSRETAKQMKLNSRKKSVKEKDLKKVETPFQAHNILISF